MTATLDRIQQHTEQYHVSPDQIATIRMDLRRLRDLGILVDVSINGLNLLYASSTWDEFGVPEEDERRKRLKKGRKNVTSSAFANKATSLSVRFRQNLDRYSYSLTGFAPFRWIPASAYFVWREEHDRLCQQLAELVASYDEAAERQQLSEAMTAVASEAYDAQCSRTQPKLSREQYTAQIVAAALARLPSAETIRNSIKASYRTAILEDNTDVARRLAELEQAELEQDHIRVERVKVQEMHRLEMEAARERIATMANPWDEMLQQFEAQLYDAAAEAMTMMQKHGYLPGKTAESLKGLRQMYEVMCVAKNERIEDALTKIESALAAKPDQIQGQTKRSYDVELVRTSLEHMATMMRQSVQAGTNEWNALEF